MSVPFSNTKIRVPHGFQNLMECLAREVIREQPNDVSAFAAVYLETLLVLRQNGGFDPVEHGIKSVDRFYNNNSFKQRDVDPSNPDQQHAALKIQTKYRQYNAKKVVKRKRADQAAIKIQAGVRGYQTRQKIGAIKLSTVSGGVDDVPTIPTEDDEKRAAAATSIQAGFRGYVTRRDIKAMKNVGDFKRPAAEIDNIDGDLEREDEENSFPEDEMDLQTNDENISQRSKDQGLSKEEAAIRIQAGARGMIARRELKSLMAGQDQDERVGSTDLQPNEAPSEDDEPRGREYEEDLESPSMSKEPRKFDTSDPQLNQAATKIQAGLRGYKVRRDLREKQLYGEQAQSPLMRDEDQPEDEEDQLRDEEEDQPEDEEEY